MNANELRALKLNTSAFIAANPTVLTLIPRTRVKSGTGTRLYDGTPRDPQVFRIIDQSASNGPQPGTVKTSDGTQRKVEYQLLGMPTVSIGLYDTWTDAHGIRWEVAEILPDNGYERRAQVTRFGES